MSLFPAGKYARYKRATAFFLDWLLRARGGGRHAGQRVQLEALNDVVKEIAADPSTLTPKLLQQLPKALAACQYAITLREHVASFFPEDDEGQVGHQYFLGLLQSWHRTLRGVEVETFPELADLQLENSKLENYYEVLQVDEDYFPDESSFVPEKDAPKSAKVDRERLFEEAFADELRMELVYLFMELDELLEGVYKVYSEVKQEKRSLVEATVVVKLAMDTASALTARLQLRYPSLRSAKDMFNIVRNSSLKSFRQKILQLHERIMSEVSDSYQHRDGTIKYVPGTFLIDLLGVGTTLDAFTAYIPVGATHSIFFPPGVFGDAYGEDRTPLYVLTPDTNNDKVFLMQQLPLLYNALADRNVAVRLGRDLAPLGPFMAIMDTFFKTREVTLPVAFACICWMKSVAALQGRRGLGRTVSLTFQHSKDLQKRIEEAVENRKALLAYNKANSLLERCTGEIKHFVPLYHIARANPLFAGLTALNHQFQYLHIANEVLFATSKLRAFGHLYNALVQEGHLERIPFFDDVYDVYGQEVFAPSRAAATHGAYYRTYLISSNLRVNLIEAVYRGEELPAPSEAYKKKKAFHLSDVSEIFRLSRLNDKSILKGGSWKDMLEDVANLCSRELFETRVLSRDLLKLNEDLTDLFPELVRVLGQQDCFSNIMDNSVAGESRQQRLSRALEESVMRKAMPLLDALQSDGSIDISAIPGAMSATVAMDALLGKELCSEIAAVINAKFSTTSEVCEQIYFTYPAQPDFVTQEYGGPDPDTRREDYEQVFEDLMKLLRESDGPLSASDLSYLKAELKKDPNLLGLISSDPDPHDATKYRELCSLLHEAAAGSAHDADLVDWMIQMGALIIQPTLHCREEPQLKDLKTPRWMYPNTMAVHNAAIAGHEDIVRVILGADNMMDLNIPTFHTKETLAHLAVKNGHKDLFNILRAFGADLRIKDGKGQSVSDVAPDREWAREIAALTAEYFAKIPGEARRSDAILPPQITPRTVHRSTLAAEHVGSRETTNTRAKSSKKKGKNSKRCPPKEESMIAAAAVAGDGVIDTKRVLMRLMQSAGCEISESMESESVTVLGDKFRKLAASIVTRLRDPSISSDDKTDDVRNACELIKDLEHLVGSYSEPSTLNSARFHIRVVMCSEAVYCIHLMQKLSRVDHAATALAPVLDLCDTTSAYADFVIGTAKLCVSVDRKPQAREIMDVLEKRLLKIPLAEREPSEFRELVQTYSTARDSMCLGQASSPKTFSRLEWYLTDNVEDYEQQLVLDGMVGRPFYFECRLTAESSKLDVARLMIGISIIPDLGDVVVLLTEMRVIYGGTSKADVANVRDMVFQVAEIAKVHFDEQSLKLCATSAHVGDFVFSNNGVVRKAPAA
ncbi:hypothetical protein GN244_ATG05128 [Phytophthora infestans]|uniref:DUF6604 domain-containing protein n=1 Tax=Phytophthora infestans TaxID=4787 RepID=A0A833T5N0_PHYIN|nr:hypothetical protein GN244_ATG05128 [Phytophthora infestans]